MDFLDSWPWWAKVLLAGIAAGSIYGGIAIERTEKKVNEILYILRDQQRDDDD